MPPFDGGNDAVWVGGPDEGLGIFVGLVDEAVDGGLKIGDGAEDAALEPAPGELCKEALDGIEEAGEFLMPVALHIAADHCRRAR